MNTSIYCDTLKDVSVVGIGNVLLGDDGFGPLVIEMFRCHYECGSIVEVLDLGTPGLDIAPYLYDKDLVILVDAIHGNSAPGTLWLIQEEELAIHRSDLHLTGHDPGIQDSLAHLRLAGHAPTKLIVVGAEPGSCELGEGISPPLLAAASTTIATIARLLNEHGLACKNRLPTSQTNIWWLPPGALTPVPA